jgi:hypothetical protein
MGEVVLLRDYHLKKLEREAAAVLGQVINYAEIAKQGGPAVVGSDPWAGKHFANGIDDMVYESSLGYHFPEQDPA